MFLGVTLRDLCLPNNIFWSKGRFQKPKNNIFWSKAGSKNLTKSQPLYLVLQYLSYRCEKLQEQVVLFLSSTARKRSTHILCHTCHVLAVGSWWLYTL